MKRTMKYDAWYFANNSGRAAEASQNEPKDNILDSVRYIAVLCCARNKTSPCATLLTLHVKQFFINWV